MHDGFRAVRLDDTIDHAPVVAEHLDQAREDCKVCARVCHFIAFNHAFTSAISKRATMNQTRSFISNFRSD